MRISAQQKTDILDCMKHFAPTAEIYLVGSRTKNSIKGGDIDLLVLVSSEKKPELLSQKLKIINEIQKKKSIDDTKVDLIIASPEDLTKDPFVVTLSKTKIKL